jgi:ribosome hibernation promoting factor
MHIEIEGVVNGVRGDIESRLGKSVGHTSARPTSAIVNFSDVNGPKGGVDIRCSLTLRLPPRKQVHAEAMGSTPLLAFNAAAEVLDRRLQRQVGRAVTTRRRPKKYFVANTLNAAEPMTLAPEGPPSVKRRRRRKAA